MKIAPFFLLSTVGKRGASLKTSAGLQNKDEL